jgi:hypothetical protein
MSAFTLEPGEIEAIAKSYDELLSYYETVGFEGDLDDEEMPSGIIPDALERLRRLLDRYAKWEHLTATVARRGGVAQSEPVRFEYRPDTPASGPPVTAEEARRIMARDDD